MKYAYITFAGWLASYLPTINHFLQFLILVVSLAIGVIGLYRNLRSRGK